MNELDKVYLLLLYSGLVAIRNAAERGDLEHCRIESEHLHEIPSLIGELNMYRHMCYATQARVSYLRWAAQTDRESVRELVTYFYAGPWKQLDTVLGIEITEQT